VNCGYCNLTNLALGFHSPSIEPAIPALRAWLDQHSQSFCTLEKPFFSTLLAREIPKYENLDTQYWV